MGNTVALTVVRVFTGSDGYRRRASDISNIPGGDRSGELTILNDVLKVSHFSQIGSGKCIGFAT